MSRILVTGGAGFIGSNLCERLVDLGHDTICLDSLIGYEAGRNYTDSDSDENSELYSFSLEKWNNIKGLLVNPRFTLAVGDIRDSTFVESLLEGTGTEVVIHLAALAGVRSSIANPLEYVDIDIAGTVSILEQCRKHGIGKIIFASSSSVYGANVPPFTEDDRVELQKSPYAAAKYCGELFCRTWSELYGISSICLRFFTVYGPRQRPDMAVHRFTKAVAEGDEVVIYGDGSSMRDYTYVDDIVDGIIAALSYKCNHESFNLGNSKTVNIMDLIGVIEAKVGRKANIRFMPLQPGDAQITCADTRKARQLLGYNPKTDIKAGIENFVKWYKENCISQD